MNCGECAAVMTDEEIKYYESRCGKCEKEWHDEIIAWRNGGENEKFDKQFSLPMNVLH